MFYDTTYNVRVSRRKSHVHIYIYIIIYKILEGTRWMCEITKLSFLQEKLQ